MHTNLSVGTLISIVSPVMISAIKMYKKYSYVPTSIKWELIACYHNAVYHQTIPKKVPTSTWSQ